RDNILELPIHLLTDPTAKVDAQILCLRRATIEDDPTQVHDWCWSLKMGTLCDDILGQYVHPINPSVSVHQPGNPTFLFEGAFLITLACSLFQELAPHERKNLPKVKPLDSFPYRSSDEACFVCEVASETDNTHIDGNADCSRCGPATKIDWENTQRVLEHMGAHILYDPSLNCTEEQCGLCLRPASMCPIYVTKGRGVQARHTVEFTKSHCLNLVRFNYKNATESTKKSPCSNVPTICPLCAPGSPAVWKYSLEAHFRNRHRLTNPSHFPCPVGQSQSEKYGMKIVWQGCFKKRKSYNSKSKRLAPHLAVSEAHRAGLPI
ncbi:hypothetical protein V8E52_006674, partial [Russula decolorans]